MDKLHASLISHEHRLNRAASSSLEHAFKHKYHLVKVKAEEHHMLEEEEEAHTEVEEAALQAQNEKATIKIQVKAQAKIKHKVRGMMNIKFNVIIVRGMVIMQINVERSNMT